MTGSHNVVRTPLSARAESGGTAVEGDSNRHLEGPEFVTVERRTPNVSPDTTVRYTVHWTPSPEGHRVDWFGTAVDATPDRSSSTAWLSVRSKFDTDCSTTVRHSTVAYVCTPGQFWFQIAYQRV
jgi:hypothetical protein